MICSACNSRNRPTARFCRSCGLEVKPLVAAEPPFAEETIPHPPLLRSGETPAPVGSGPKWVDLTTIDFGSNVITKADAASELIIDEYDEEAIEDERREGFYIDFGSSWSASADDDVAYAPAEECRHESCDEGDRHRQHFDVIDGESEESEDDEQALKPSPVAHLGTASAAEGSNIAFLSPRLLSPTFDLESAKRTQEITQELPSVELEPPADPMNRPSGDLIPQSGLANLAQFKLRDQEVGAASDKEVPSSKKPNAVDATQASKSADTTISFAPPESHESASGVPMLNPARQVAAHCRSCFMTFRRSDRFCTECGGMLVRPDSSSMQRIPECNRCRVPISPRHKFCPCCGNSALESIGLPGTAEFSSGDSETEDVPTLHT